jgi:hypothetical protein
LRNEHGNIAKVLQLLPKVRTNCYIWLIVSGVVLQWKEIHCCRNFFGVKKQSNIHLQLLSCMHALLGDVFLDNSSHLSNLLAPTLPLIEKKCLQVHT